MSKVPIDDFERTVRRQITIVGGILVVGFVAIIILAVAL